MPAFPPIRTQAVRRRHAPRRLATGLAFLAIASLFGACGAQRPVLAPVNPKLRATTTTAAALIPTSAPATTTKVTAAPKPSFRRLRPGSTTMHGLIATPIGNPLVHRNPSLASPIIPIGRVNAIGVTTVFAIIGNDSTPWVEVLLPTRPNGAIGWVQRSTIRVATTDARVFVNLGRRLLTVTRGKYTLMQATVAIGTVTNPTPTGPTFVTELIDTGDANGTYGPYAFGLGLHSDTLSEFGGGDGQVGIHGTNTPKLIGQRVSHGCVRLTNENVRRLVKLKLALGTPVFIR